MKLKLKLIKEKNESFLDLLNRSRYFSWRSHFLGLPQNRQIKKQVFMISILRRNTDKSTETVEDGSEVGAALDRTRGSTSSKPPSQVNWTLLNVILSGIVFVLVTCFELIIILQFSSFVDSTFGRGIFVIWILFWNYLTLICKPKTFIIHQFHYCTDSKSMHLAY